MTPVSEPNSASADVAREIGRFYTQGMPEDVNALKDKALSDREFLGQSDLVHDEGVRLMDLALRRWRENERGGLAFFYFSGIDLCGHMLWRHHDAEHPHHDAEFAKRDLSDWSGIPGDQWKNVVFDLYLRMDPVLGRLRETLPPDALLIVMSDHGFESYRRKFNLNTWLFENGYLVLKPGLTKELPREDPQYRPITLVNDVDWSKTRAYGVGFNALYLNLKGRELDNPATPEDESGIVEWGAQADALMAEIAAKLVATRDGQHQPVLRVDRAVDAYHGPRVPEAPDLLVGYNAGYGNSDPSTLGRVPAVIVEDNLGGTFNGNHLMAPEVVEGTLLTNGKVLSGMHKLEDLTVEILRQYGIQPGADMRGRPVLE
jgi:predicted AlkP superfamily phosphohydrolase/phosphomutase